MEKEFGTVGNEGLNFNTFVMLTAHLCFRKLKAVNVLKCSPLRALTHRRARKRMIMSNVGKMSSRGNGVNSEGNLTHCAAVLVRLIVM